MDQRNSAFTLIELLVVIAIIAVLSVTVILSLNPAELLRQSRDTNRLSDMDTLNHALSVYSVDQSGMPSFFMGSSSIVYVSLPDSSSTCGTWSLPTLPTGYTYACVASTTLKNTNGTGWIPVPLSSTSGGSPVGNLPIDPTNQSSSRLYYTYTTNGTQYELTTNLESAKYKLGGPSDQITGDGGTLATVYEKGSKLGLEPLDYGDTALAGLWTFDEGTGSVAYDYSGSSASGTFSSPAPTWATGRIGSGALSFNGSSNYVRASSTNLNITGSQVTLSLWMNAAAIQNSQTPAGNGLNTNGYYIEEYGSSTPYEFIAGLSGSGTTVVLSSTTTNGQWTYLTFTYDGANLRAYTNGVLSNTAAGSGNIVSASRPFYIGSWIGPSYYFSGSVDDVRVYSRALSATEVAALYNGGK